MSDQIIHIGFPKTGTTYLQENVLPYLDVTFEGFKSSASVLGKLVYADPLDYDIEEIIQKIKLNQSDKPHLYSFENLTGSPFYYKGLNRSTIPQKLKELGFSKVVITIRNQMSAIDSYYRQYVVQGGTLGFRSFLDLDNQRPWQSKFFNMNYLKYDILLRRYCDVFGAENVLVISQEELRKSEEKCIASLTHFLGVKLKERTNPRKSENVSLTNLSLRILRFMNHFTYSSISPHHLISSRFSNTTFFKFLAVIFDPYFGRIFSKKRSFVDRFKLRSQLKQLYADSNEALYSNFGIDYRN